MSKDTFPKATPPVPKKPVNSSLIAGLKKLNIDLTFEHGVARHIKLDLLNDTHFSTYLLFFQEMQHIREEDWNRI